MVGTNLKEYEAVTGEMANAKKSVSCSSAPGEAGPFQPKTFWSTGRKDLLSYLGYGWVKFPHEQALG